MATTDPTHPTRRTATGAVGVVGVDAGAVRAVLDTMVSCRVAADRLEADLLALAVELVALHPVDDTDLDDVALAAPPRTTAAA